jgi:hypothetical protein
MATSTVNLGRVKPIFRGDYSESFQYNPLDFLRYSGVTYFCKVIPPLATLPTNTTYFAPVNDSDTAASVLAKMLTVDGADSLLDADKLDGQEGAYYSPATHVHTGTYQPVDADLTAIGGLAGTTGLLKKTAANTWTLDTNTYLTTGGALSGGIVPITNASGVLISSTVTAAQLAFIGTLTQNVQTALTAATAHAFSTNNPHSTTKAQVGLTNVENKSSATIRGELISYNVTTALGFTPLSNVAPAMFRNKIYNGAFRLWTDWPTGRSGNIHGSIVSDKWEVLGNSNCSCWPNTSDNYNIGVSTTLVLQTGIDWTGELKIRRVFEQLDIKDVIGQYVTLSCWVKCTRPSVELLVCAYNTTGGTNTISAITVTPNTWTFVTLTSNAFLNVTAVPDNTPNRVRGFVDIGYNTLAYTVTSADALLINNVQFEKGSIATGFERIPIELDRLLCLRAQPTW